MKGRADRRIFVPYKEGNTGHGPTPARVVPGGGMKGGRGSCGGAVWGAEAIAAPVGCQYEKTAISMGFLQGFILRVNSHP